ncbi:MAG TPA: RHS repeat-associated core domain-containing protein, partial [Anaerolineae bacterium]|nr:RHS repeat-associated core domain-containing protein [Anaerolineae bacterium]
KRKDSASGPLVAEYFYDAAEYKGLQEKSKAYTDEGVVEVRALAYDARNRLTEQEWVIPGAGGGTFRMSYAYNAADQQVSITYPGGNNGQAGEVVSHSYNDVGQLTGVSGAGVQYLSAATYNPLGQPTELRLDTGNNGLWRNFDYDAGTLRLQTLRAGKNAAHDDIQRLSYAYDNVGNVLSITDALNAGQVQTFGYDWLNRLTSAATNGAGTGQYSHAYSYDAIGNITAKDGQGYVYGGGKPHAVTGALGNSYSYDGNGNMTTRVIAGVTYTLSYDYENRLLEVKQGATVMATFLYDADGNRVKGTVNGVTTVYIAGVYEWQAGAATQYYQGPTGPLALRRTGHGSDDGVFYMLPDHLGSTSILVDQAGTVQSQQYYLPYGDNRGGPFSTLTTKRYTGQYHEEALGLYFYGARWYDPLLGHFTQADTLIPDPSAPQALNRYAYTLNNPLRYVDPSGHRYVHQ